MSSGPKPEDNSINEQGVTLLVRVTPKASKSTFAEIGWKQIGRDGALRPRKRTSACVVEASVHGADQTRE